MKYIFILRTLIIFLENYLFKFIFFMIFILLETELSIIYFILFQFAHFFFL